MKKSIELILLLLVLAIFSGFAGCGEGDGEDENDGDESADGDDPIKDGDVQVLDGDEQRPDGDGFIQDGDWMDGDKPDGDALITDGDAFITDGDAIITDGDAVITDGDVIITDGDAIITDGDVIITDGDVIITDGDVIITDGDVIITDGDVTDGDLTDGDIELEFDWDLDFDWSDLDWVDGDLDLDWPELDFDLEEGDAQCRSCNVYDCPSGYGCFNWTLSPLQNWCAAICYEQANCDSGFTCKDTGSGTMYCIPDIEMSCEQNDLHVSDSCGTSYVYPCLDDTETCNDAEGSACTINDPGPCTGTCSIHTCNTYYEYDLCLCYDDGNYGPFDCDRHCVKYGYDSGACFDSSYYAEADCTCDYSNCQNVQTYCEELDYNNCTCDASDPCGWVGDGWCDAECGERYPDNYFDDSADCSKNNSSANPKAQRMSSIQRNFSEAAERQAHSIGTRSILKP